MAKAKNKAEQKTTKKTSKKTTEKTPTPTLEEIAAHVALATQDRKFAPVAISDFQKEVTLVTAGNGLFRVRKTQIALFISKIADFEIPGLPTMEAGPVLLIPKMPMHLIIEVLSYYRAVYEQDKTEASVLFFWNHNNVPLPNFTGVKAEGQIVVFCPKQRNAGTTTDFLSGNNTEASEVEWFRNHMTPLMETHSHHTMGAFWSGTDDAFENYPQFYMVFGKITDSKIQIEFRWCEGPNKNGLSPDFLIHWPSARVQSVVTTVDTVSFDHLDGQLFVDEYMALVNDENERQKETVEHKVDNAPSLLFGPFKEIDFPKEWLTEQHHKNTYSFSNGYGGKYDSYLSSYGYGKSEKKWGNGNPNQLSLMDLNDENELNDPWGEVTDTSLYPREENMWHYREEEDDRFASFDVDLDFYAIDQETEPDAYEDALYTGEGYTDFLMESLRFCLVDEKAFEPTRVSIFKQGGR